MSGLVDKSADARSKTIGSNFRVRAWVNFNGGNNGSVGIRDSGNVSSIARNSAGVYDVNFINKPPYTNQYCVSVSGNVNNSNQDTKRACHRVVEFNQDSFKIVCGFGNTDSKEDQEFLVASAIW